MTRTAERIICGSFILGIVLASGLAAPRANASEFRHGDIRIEQPWARATIGKGRVGVAYMHLKNAGSENDRLIGAKTPVAERAELHMHRMSGDIMQMRPVDDIPIPAGGSAMLKPGGLHIMLMRLTRTLRKGEKFPLTLTFERAGTVTVEVAIKSATAKSATGMHHHGG